MIDFSTVKSIRLSQGEVQSLHVNGVTLWQKTVSILPAGYTQLKYIEATGKQYISIPVTVRGTDDEVFAVDTDIQFTNHTSRMLMGFSTSVGAYWGVGANLSYYDFGGSSYAIELDPSVRRVVHFHRVNRNGTLSVDSEEITRAGAASLSNLPWSIFSVGGTSNACRAKLYGAKITEDSVLTYDLIPCLDPVGAPCLFDIVTQQAFYNNGSDDFIYPANATPAVSADLDEKFYAKLTPNGVCRLYKVPDGCNMTKEEYAMANGFKERVEPPMPQTGYWKPEWRETDTQIILDWVETESQIMEEI